MSLPLDPDAAQRDRLACAALELIETLLVQRDAAPIFVPTPPALVEAMLAPPGEQGAEAARVFAELLAAAQCGWSKRQGGDLAFIPNGGLYSGMVAALLASGVHAFTAAAFESPALVALEESVLRWLAATLGLPGGSEGLLLSGGSLANQTAIVCARERGDFVAGRSSVYLSERAHHSLPKALHVAGIPQASVRSIAADAHGRIRLDMLRERIARDRRDGALPWLLIGVAGSTDTGSIDDLEALAALAAEQGLWFHVDAAYGGMFALTERGRARLRGIGAADSLTVDAHKGLMLPYGVAALLVRRPGALARAHGGGGAYLRDVPPPGELPHYHERGPELTRPFRGLLVWLPLQLHGVAAFRAALDRCLDLAEQAAARLRALPGVELVQEPELSIVALRVRAGDAATLALLEAIHQSGRLHVSSTTLQGRVVLRLAFLHPRTSAADLDALLRIVEAFR